MANADTGADTEAQVTATPVGGNDQDNQRHLRVGGYDLSVDNEKVPLLGVAASAIVLLIAVGIGYVEKKMKSYGFSLGGIALIIGVLGLVPTPDAIGKYSLYLNYFLFLWCFVGACVMTFGNGPFTVTGNGYFASWALAIFSTMSMGITKSKMPENFRKAYAETNVILGLGACSVVTMIACIPQMDSQYRGENLFALIISILTILVVATFVYAKMKENLQIQQFEVPALMVFAILWILAACMTTFRGPFLTTGNGYFAVWAGSVLAVKAALSALSAKNSGSQEEE